MAGMNDQPSPALPPAVVVSARGVGKKFCRNLRRSMTYGISELAQNLVGISPRTDRLRRDEFWALQGVDFDLRKGEVLGLIGPNGGGKSTLLRTLAGILPPDTGEVAIRGRLGALIALGAGFHPHMTGRENVYLNGAILGMTRRDIRGCFDAIVDFAEIGPFIDAPVATYSSGMRIRLGFAIAMAINPDVLLIDEVIAVGDVGFRAKCYNAVRNLAHRSATIFVSHNLPVVTRICTRLIVLEGGRILVDTHHVADGVKTYLETFALPTGNVFEPGDTHIRALRLDAADTDERPRLVAGSPLVVTFEVTAPRRCARIKAALSVLSRDMDVILQSHSINDGFEIANPGVPLRLAVALDHHNLASGTYHLSLAVSDAVTSEILAWHRGTLAFDVIGKEHDTGAPVLVPADWELSP